MRVCSRALVVTALAAVALPASAHAAYAPKLDVQIDPATPRTAATVAITVRQRPGESASRTQVVRFPRELRFNPAFAVEGCRRAQEDAQVCPESSRIGTALAETELGSFSGAVYLTEDFRTVIFLRGFGGLVQSKVEGEMRVAADGSVETVIDNLPPVRSTFAQVRLLGGSRSLVLTPRRCAPYPVRGRFLSHEAEVATSDSTFAITGCETHPAIQKLSARRRGRSIAVAWTLSAQGRVRVKAERRVRSRRWERWRRVAPDVRRASRKGRNRMRIRRRGRRRLRPGVYRITLRAFNASGRLTDIRRIRFRVRRRR